MSAGAWQLASVIGTGLILLGIAAWNRALVAFGTVIVAACATRVTVRHLHAKASHFWSRRGAR